MSEQPHRRKLEKDLQGPEPVEAEPDTPTAPKENESRYRTLLRNIQAAVVVHDTDTRVIASNPKVQEVLGLTEDQLLGKVSSDPHWRFLDEEGEILPVELYPANQVIETRQPLKDFTIGVSRPDRTGTMWFVASGNPVFDDRGEILEVIITFMDITDYKMAEEERGRLEQRLIQTQKLEAIGTLAGGIAHDFNNILSGIFGYAHLADLNLDQPEKAKANLAQIVKGAQRAAGLVHQILTYSRQTEYEKRGLKLFVVVKESLKLLRSTIPATIEIKQEVVSKAEVLADPTQIHQVIMNLCTNAYQAMRDTGGELKVGLNEVQVSPETPLAYPGIPSGKYLVLEVGDTGVGMDRKTLEKIFDPYFTTKEVGEGTGLGLSTVFGIIEEHQGYIRVKSNPGKGSIFKVFFPIMEPDPEGEDSIQTDILAGGTEQIMIVDDETAILDSCRELLEDFGYRVFTFEAGDQALEAFEKDPRSFDLIITDMTMPGMTGVDLSKKILEIRKSMPIILCTGYSDLVSEDQALALGIRKYLPKPASGRTIIQSVRQVLDQGLNPEEGGFAHGRGS
ncbi:hybrid sensor histidine kinase/response regulator [Desulfospira joergensenii]|uniref:hybrid sensor histidine kinase/response regulator n=1 Tax=Desulfospira joergensenii TaxID=53329 RepID=UPI0003B55FCD|nr:response regulator [Desulfospira joergensenii]